MLDDKEKVHCAKQALGDRNAELIVQLMRIAKWDPKRKRGCCPFHKDETPSFAYNPRQFNFKCFGCGRNADIIDAYQHAGFSHGDAFVQLFKEAGGARPSAIEDDEPKPYRYPTVPPLNSKARVYEYWSKRKISKATIDYADVREDEHGNTAFLYYDLDERLTMVKYRPSRRIEKDEGRKMWCQKVADTTPLLFNMNRTNKDLPLLITEGEGDTLAAIEAGYKNVVSVPYGSSSFSFLDTCRDYLEQFKRIIICADNDEAGHKMQCSLFNHFGAKRVRFVDIPDIYTTEGNAKVSIKDLSEALFYMGKGAVFDLIKKTGQQF